MNPPDPFKMLEWLANGARAHAEARVLLGIEFGADWATGNWSIDVARCVQVERLRPAAVVALAFDPLTLGALLAIGQ